MKINKKDYQFYTYFNLNQCHEHDKFYMERLLNNTPLRILLSERYTVTELDRAVARLEN